LARRRLKLTRVNLGILAPMPCSRLKRTSGKRGEHTTAGESGRIEELTTREVSFINIFGTYFATRAEALKDWTGVGCDVKSVSVTDATGTMLSSTVGILRFNGAADGTCYGQKVGPIWGTSVYLRDGDAWKWTFGINLPAPPEAA